MSNQVSDDDGMEYTMNSLGERRNRSPRRLGRTGRICTGILSVCLLWTTASAAGIFFGVEINPDPAVPGEQLAIEITVANDDAFDHNLVELRLDIPAGLNAFNENLVTGPINTGASCKGGIVNTSCTAGETLRWDIGTLAANQIVSGPTPLLISQLPTGSVLGFRATSLSLDSGNESRVSRAVPEPGLLLALGAGTLLLGGLARRRRTICHS